MNHQDLKKLPLVLTLSASTLAAVGGIPEAVKATPCTPDPFAGEVCTPSYTPPEDPKDPPPETPNDPPERPPVTPLIPGVPPNVIFERNPFRSFERFAPTPEPIPEPEPEPTPDPEVQEEVPIRALWSKDDHLSDAVAIDYVDRKLATMLIANDHGATRYSGAGETPTVQFGDQPYLERISPNTLLFSQPNLETNISTWVRGYGSGGDGLGYRGNTDVSSGGVAFGVDVDLSSTVRLGAYGNYGSSNSSDRYGSWSPDGWGGGITADYWTDSFYVQGLFGGIGYGGNHKRHVNGDTASGHRSGESWNGAIRIGAPIDAGSLYLEPQAQVAWTSAILSSFTENGVDRSQRLHYKSRNLDWFDTELALKLAAPLRQSERSLLMPSLRLGWVANWGQSQPSQQVNVVNNDKTYSYGGGDGNSNGLLVEAGLDYTTYNFSDTSIAVFVRGGPVFWDQGRGTSWRAWGGIGLRF